MKTCETRVVQAHEHLLDSITDQTHARFHAESQHKYNANHKNPSFNQMIFIWYFCQYIKVSIHVDLKLHHVLEIIMIVIIVSCLTQYKSCWQGLDGLELNNVILSPKVWLKVHNFSCLGHS